MSIADKLFLTVMLFIFAWTLDNIVKELKELNSRLRGGVIQCADGLRGLENALKVKFHLVFWDVEDEEHYVSYTYSMAEIFALRLNDDRTLIKVFEGGEIYETDDKIHHIAENGDITTFTKERD